MKKYLKFFIPLGLVFLVIFLFRKRIKIFFSGKIKSKRENGERKEEKQTEIKKEKTQTNEVPQVESYIYNKRKSPRKLLIKKGDNDFRFSNIEVKSGELFGIFKPGVDSSEKWTTAGKTYTMLKVLRDGNEYYIALANAKAVPVSEINTKNAVNLDELAEFVYEKLSGFTFDSTKKEVAQRLEELENNELQDLSDIFEVKYGEKLYDYLASEWKGEEIFKNVLKKLAK